MKTFSSSMEKSVVDSSRLLEVAVLVCYSICFFHEVKQRCSQRQTESPLLSTKDRCMLTSAVLTFLFTYAAFLGQLKEP